MQSQITHAVSLQHIYISMCHVSEPLAVLKNRSVLSLVADSLKELMLYSAEAEM